MQKLLLFSGADMELVSENRAYHAILSFLHIQKQVPMRDAIHLAGRALKTIQAGNRLTAAYQTPDGTPAFFYVAPRPIPSNA